MLSTPPAFVLSQDQTLNKMVSKRSRVQITLLKLFTSFKFLLLTRVIDVQTPLRSFFVQAYFRMLNSGAFRSLHCLIYKVLAPLRSVAEHSLSYHTQEALSSTFFDFFQNLFSYSTARPSRSESFVILPRSLGFVKHFFQLFQSFFSAQPVRRSRLRKLD